MTTLLSSNLDRPPFVAVIIPCYNEAATIAAVVHDFRRYLPDAAIYVFDNDSSDDTADIARQAGAQVHHVMFRGKGNVVRRMFADIEADLYVMVDGDGTYDISAAPMLIQSLCDQGLDMVVGSRVAEEALSYRKGHRFGNALLTQCVAALFGRGLVDMLSGYRVMSRRYVKSFAAHAHGFEIETELTVHALQLRMPMAEIRTAYGARPEGSDSKLNTYRDGIRILWAIARLYRQERPLQFFSFGFFGCEMMALVLGIPLIQTFLQTGLVPRLPTAVLCSALVILGFLLLTSGLVLDTVTRGRLEAKHFSYLSIAAPSGLSAPRPAASRQAPQGE